MNTSTLHVSIVIATIGRENQIIGCLQSMIKVGTPPEVEVVVVDAGGEGWVDEQALKAAWPNSRVFRSDIKNAGVQRNMGVKLAHGEIIIFLDDDCYIQPGWWPAIISPLCEQGAKSEEQGAKSEGQGAKSEEQGAKSEGQGAESEEQGAESEEHGVKSEEQGAKREEERAKREVQREMREKPMTQSGDEKGCRNLSPSALRSLPFIPCPLPLAPSSPPIACVAGAIWRNPSPQFTDERGGYVNWFGYPIQVTHRSEKAPREVDWPISCNMACLKSAYVEVGGMAAVYGIYDEDVDLGLKWRKAGWRIVFEPRAAVYHYSISQQQRVVTKATEFRVGRNRAMLLVRNYGFSLRLILFVTTAPVVQLWKVIRDVGCYGFRRIGHYGAHMLGVLSGLCLGVMRPAAGDRADFKLEC